jgi:hypothetical protein
MSNFLEQLVAEWYECQGFFVRRNFRVGKRVKGGYEGELDVVAFHPKEKRIVHIEASSDASSWERREESFRQKFAKGRKYISEVFPDIDVSGINVEAIALLAEVRGKKHPSKVGEGTVKPMDEFLDEIKAWLPGSTERVIPEQYVILRSLQLAKDYWLV